MKSAGKIGNEWEVRDAVTCTQRIDAKPDTAQHRAHRNEMTTSMNEWMKKRWKKQKKRNEQTKTKSNNNKTPEVDGICWVFLLEGIAASERN